MLGIEKRKPSLTPPEKPLAPEPTPEQIRVRERLSWLLKPVLRATSIDRENGRERATEFAEQHNYGIVVLFNHPDKVSSFVIADEAFVRNPVLKKRRITYPVALHQEGKALDWLEEHGAFQYPKIVTDDTHEDPEYKDAEGDGGKEFMRQSRNALEHGGSVAIAFQGGRREYLDVEKGKSTVGVFLKKLNPRKKPGDEGYFNNFGFLFVGYGEPKRRDYYKGAGGGGLRLFKKKELVFGPFITHDELLKMAGGDVGKVDQIVRDIEATLVPSAYLKPPTEKAKQQHERNSKLIYSAAAVGAGLAAGYRLGKKHG